MGHDHPEIINVMKNKNLPAIHNIFRFVLPFIIVGSIWELLVLKGYINLQSLPAPSTLLEKFWQLAVINGSLWKHFLNSLYRLIIGYSLAAVFGTLIGALMAQNETLKAIFEPTFNILMSVPTIAWIPIFLITLGLGDRTVITAIFISSFFSIMYNTMRGIEMVDKSIVRAARTMGLNRSNLFFNVLLPASLVSIINGFRLAIGYAWRALVGGELLAAMIEWGLGKMVYQARYFNDAAVMLVGLLVIGFTGYFLDQIFLITIEKNTVEKWGMSQRK
jgi:ABC-type nitrate/sulfonate/bicarbonate transport system permease component